MPESGQQTKRCANSLHANNQYEFEMRIIIINIMGVLWRFITAGSCNARAFCNCFLNLSARYAQKLLNMHRCLVIG